MREQFTFYVSFFETLSYIKKKADKADAYDAIAAYALYGTEPDLDKLADAAAMAFVSARKVIDASRRRAESGKKGGEAKANSKQTSSKPLANSKQEGVKQDKEQVKEQDKGKEQLLQPLPLADADLSKVMSVYLDRFNSLPSSGCVEDLKAFTADLGADVVLHAFGRAQDEKKTGWSYIRGILQNYTRAGYRTLDAVLQGEAAFDAAKAKKAEAKAPATAQTKGVTAEDMARMNRMLAKMTGEATDG